MGGKRGNGGGKERERCATKGRTHWVYIADVSLTQAYVSLPGAGGQHSLVVLARRRKMRRHPRYGTIVGRCLDGANQDASGGLGGLGGGNDDPYEEEKRKRRWAG